jgi:hypothetical protein
MTGNFFQQITNALISYNYEIIKGSNVFDSGNYMEKRVYYNKLDPTYGISYVPGSVGGGGTGGGGGIIITPEPVVPTQPEQTTSTGFDFESLLSNPIVLIGLAVGVYLLVKDRL